VGHRERGREREREFKYMGMLRGKLQYNRERERERERDGERACEGRRRFRRKRVSEAALVRERGIAREHEGEEVYPRNLEKPTLFIPTHRLAPPPLVSLHSGPLLIK
jgi:hypothetical protein